MLSLLMAGEWLPEHEEVYIDQNRLRITIMQE